MSLTNELLASTVAALQGKADFVVLQGEDYPTDPAPRTLIVVRDLVETGAVTYGGISTINLIQVGVYAENYQKSLALAEECLEILTDLDGLRLTFRSARPVDGGRMMDFDSHRG